MVVDVFKVGAIGGGSGNDGEWSSDVIGHHLLQSTIEKKGAWIVVDQIDDSDSDGVGSIDQFAVWTTDVSVGCQVLTAGCHSVCSQISSWEILSIVLDSINVDNVSSTSLHSQFKAVVACGVERNSGSKEPNVVTL